MAKEIKQKIVLEGEREYNQAIKEAQRNLKTLKSELKAETAELGKNATEQQKAEAKARSLKQQIAEQEKIVKTLREALEQARKEYGDNADVVQGWEQKLNNARTTLANMKNDLDGVGQSFQGVNANAAQATVATKSVADALGSIGSAGESVSSAIESIFTGLIDTVANAVEQLWGMITETAARANNWTDLASYYGSSASEIQMWSKSIQAAGGDFTKFTSIVDRLAFGGKEKKITELLGISKENYQNDVQYTLAVMDELQKKREQLSRSGFDNIMSEIFGAKKSTDVNWFLSNAYGHEGENGDWIHGWRDNPEQYNGEGSYGMTADEIGTMNDLYVKVCETETKWKDLKDQFAAGFGGVALDLMVNVEGTLDGIADYMNATSDSEKQAALDKIRTNVEQFFTKLGEIIRDTIHIIKDVGMSLQESDDPLTAAIGDILVKLSEALQWMVDHQEEVKKAFEAIFGLWLLGKLAAVAGRLGSILMQIEAIKAFKGVTVATSAAEAAGGAAGASWGAGFGAAVLKAVPWLAGLLVLIDTSNHGSNDIWDENGNPTGEIPGLTMTEEEYNAAWERYRSGDETGIWDENGKRTDLGAQLGVEETRDEELRKRWIQDEAKRYRDEGKYAAEWALYGTEGGGYAGQYKSIQEYWDKYRSGTATKEDWDELNSNFKSEKMQENLIGVLKQLYELDRSIEDVPDWIFGLERRYGELEEEVDLGNGYDERDREIAVQDWWDAWLNAMQGKDSWEEEESAFQYFQDVFGDDFADVFYRITEKLNEMEDQTKLDDIPEEWWRTTNSWNDNGGAAGENGVTSGDLQSFREVPAAMQKAVQAGAAAGVSGIQVRMDGRAVGELVAPYVSTIIARSIV